MRRKNLQTEFGRDPYGVVTSGGTAGEVGGHRGARAPFDFRAVPPFE